VAPLAALAEQAPPAPYFGHLLERLPGPLLNLGAAEQTKAVWRPAGGGGAGGGQATK
jgi:hypothetical protein